MPGGCRRGPALPVLPMPRGLPPTRPPLCLTSRATGPRTAVPLCTTHSTYTPPPKRSKALNIDFYLRAKVLSSGKRW